MPVIAEAIAKAVMKTPNRLEGFQSADDGTCLLFPQSDNEGYQYTGAGSPLAFSNHLLGFIRHAARIEMPNTRADKIKDSP